MRCITSHLPNTIYRLNCNLLLGDGMYDGLVNCDHVLFASCFFFAKSALDHELRDVLFFSLSNYPLSERVSLAHFRHRGVPEKRRLRKQINFFTPIWLTTDSKWSDISAGMACMPHRLWQTLQQCQRNWNGKKRIIQFRREQVARSMLLLLFLLAFHCVIWNAH